MLIFWNKALSIMKEKKLKQIDLADATGKNKSSVSDWINHDVYPKVDDALKIADLLGVSVRYLVTGQDDAMPSPPLRRLLELAQGFSDAEISWFCQQMVNYRMLEERKKGEVSPDTSASEIG